MNMTNTATLPTVEKYGGIAMEISSFVEKEEHLKNFYEEIEPHRFYRFLFPEGSFERLGHQEDSRPNGIALSIYKNKDGKNCGRHTIITDGLEQLEDLLTEPCVISSPISYYGRSRKAENASYLHALTFDIDYVDLDKLQNLLYQMEDGLLPAATFVVNSGHGVHLYYVLDEPVAMYEAAQKELKKLKKALIRRLWTKYTSTKPDAVEALGIVQGFRMVGSQSKIGEEYKVRAFCFGRGERVSIEHLNSFVNPDEQALDFKYKSRLTLDEAKRKYPEWYNRRIVKGQAPGRWYVKRDLYDWFKRQLLTGASIGHRYFCIMSLAIFANKCGIDEEELYKDAMYFQDYFKMLDRKGNNPFAVDETLQALECFNDSYARYPRETIERITGISMPANKRNYRAQAEHLKRARFSRDLNCEEKGTVWFNQEGRPKGKKDSKPRPAPRAEMVRKYFEEHPDSTVRAAADALGVSKNTVQKWKPKKEQ